MSHSISGNNTPVMQTSSLASTKPCKISKPAIVGIIASVAVVAIAVILLTATALISSIACPIIFAAALITTIVLLASTKTSFVGQSRFPQPVLVHNPRVPVIHQPRLVIPNLQPPRRQHPGDTLGHRALHGKRVGIPNSNSGMGRPLAPMSAVPTGAALPANQVGNRFVTGIPARPGAPAIPARVIPGHLFGAPAAGRHNHHGPAGSSASCADHHDSARRRSS